MPMAQAKKTGFIIVIVHNYIHRKLDTIEYDAWFFSVVEICFLSTGY